MWLGLWSGVTWGLMALIRAGIAWRSWLYWSNIAWEGASVAVGGFACSGGVRGSLAVLVRSAIGLVVRVVSVSRVLSLSFAVLGLVVMSAAVEAIVVMSESVAGVRGDSVVGGAVWWLGGAGLSVVLSGNCWAIHKQVQFSLMVWQWNAGGAGVWIVQCLCRVWRSFFLSSVTSVWVTFRTVALSVVMRRSMGDREVRRCVRIQVWVARRYARTKRPQS